MVKVRWKKLTAIAVRGVKKVGDAKVVASRVARKGGRNAVGTVAGRIQRTRYVNWPSRVRRSGTAGSECIAESTGPTCVWRGADSDDERATDGHQHRPS